MTAIDNNLVIAAKQLGAQAGKTLDAITREVLAGGTNVQYAEGQVTSRDKLVGGAETGNHLPDRGRRAPCGAHAQKAERRTHRRQLHRHHPPRTWPMTS